MSSIFGEHHVQFSLFIPLYDPSAKFGFHYVDFTDPSRARVPKASSEYYGDIARANGFADTGKPCSLN